MADAVRYEIRGEHGPEIAIPSCACRGQILCNLRETMDEWSPAQSARVKDPVRSRDIARRITRAVVEALTSLHR